MDFHSVTIKSKDRVNGNTTNFKIRFNQVLPSEKKFLDVKLKMF